MSRRKMDMQAESELAHFLDQFFYSRLVNSGELTSAERVSAADIQRMGVDVIAKKDHACAYIDEKAQLYYINEGLPTFAFELSFLFGEETRIGWFLNDELLTNRYFLLWPHASTTDLCEITVDSFTVVYGLMIKKTVLLNYLESIGLAKQVLASFAHELRMNGAKGRVSTGHEGVYFYVSESERYSEAPVNIVIAKRILDRYASAYYEIRPEELKKLK